MPRIRILVADDHAFVRMGIMKEISKTKAFSVVAEVNNGEDALERIVSLKPDIAVLDLDMPGLNGLEVCSRLKDLGHGETRVVMLTMYKEYELFEKALELGVKAYILKDHAATELTEAIFKAHEGINFAGKNLDRALVKRESLYLKNHKIAKLLQLLTISEKNILNLIADQKTTREIASLNFISEKTVENHRHNICKKLRLDNSKNSLLLFALGHKDFLRTL